MARGNSFKTRVELMILKVRLMVIDVSEHAAVQVMLRVVKKLFATILDAAMKHAISWLIDQYFV